MKILMICGVYTENDEKDILAYSKGYVEQSANIFQRKIIRGIEENNIAHKIISAPLIGAYPMRYKKSRFNGFQQKSSEYEYVSFNNIWGVRNISRAKALKKAIKEYFKTETEEEFLILVYCPHTPFLEAATYAKKLKPKSQICLVVPDLPQYMNLNEKGRGLYDFFKKFDIQKMGKHIAGVDSFVLLTEPMKDVLKVGNRPYLVAEGIVDDFVEQNQERDKHDSVKRIVYTGKMNMKFGIKELVDSFMLIKGADYRLVLCGDGDAREYVEKKAQEDERIEYKGMVTAKEAANYINMADVLVNPRPNNEEYTKYSFPSKNIEYLMTGKPVVAYMLDGMPEKYRDFLYEIPKNKLSFEEELLQACDKPLNKLSFKEYARLNLESSRIIEAIIKMHKPRW